MVIPIRASKSAWTAPARPDGSSSGPAGQSQRRHLRAVPTPRQLPPPLARRQDSAVRRAFPWLARVTDHYFGATVEGVEHLSDRASLVVSTHNGSWVMPDLLSLMVAFWRRFGLESAAYGLFHRLGLQVPHYGRWMTRLGAIEASWDNARLVLSEGYPLLVCPGGDADALKPYWRRHQVDFGRHRGFIRLAIDRRVPIIPVVSVGAHEVFFVVNDGRRLARWTGAASLLRLKAIPWTLSFPVGLTPGGIGAIPLPSRVRVQVLPPIELDEHRTAADDDDRVERCYHHVRSTMQRALNRLAAARRFPVLG